MYEMAGSAKYTTTTNFLSCMISTNFDSSADDIGPEPNFGLDRNSGLD